MSDYAVMPYADYQDACDAVREKTGGTEVIKSGDMGTQIRAIESGASLETVHITLTLYDGPVHTVVYSYVKDGEIVNRYLFDFYSPNSDELGHFVHGESGGLMIGELDVPKGGIIAIGHNEGGYSFQISNQTKCSYCFLDEVNMTSIAIYNIEDGATITALL